VNHAFKISGEFNLLCFVAASDLQTIEKLVDLCFRKDPNVINVKTNILIDSVHDFVIPIDFQIEKFDFHSNICGPDCNLNVNLPKYKFDASQEEVVNPFNCAILNLHLAPQPSSKVGVCSSLAKSTGIIKSFAISVIIFIETELTLGSLLKW